MTAENRFINLYQPYYESLDLDDQWQTIVTDAINTLNDGNLDYLLSLLDDLPDIPDNHITLTEDVISVDGEIEYNDHEKINKVMRHLLPWRKGPFKFYDIDIDAEWQCHMKWNRLIDHISPLKNRSVLDVGCNNGYFGWRMRGAGARQVIGIDPSVIAVIQFMAVNHIVKDINHMVFPLKMEDIPPKLQSFDTVFSMGVLYHRRDPLDHIAELYHALRPGGELVIETLVVEGEDGVTFMPPGRYARMNNVWFLPSTDTLETWLKKIGFDHVRTIDINTTSLDEQRTTDWKPGVSLREYLDPTDITKTIEGHPAPLRAMLIAEKPKTQKKSQRYVL